MGGEGIGEGGVLVAVEHPAAVDRDAAGGHGCDGAVRLVAGQCVVVDHGDVDPGFAGGVGLGRERGLPTAQSTDEAVRDLEPDRLFCP
ncbi:hypothetical protein ACIBO1_29715 [Micromonospora sp. NPDC049903]|uniref:hypothetical protein n=1 Tax=Micromonospora sp. NPDC049903 TaxID=3364276 RepID=UPI00379E9EDF